MERTVTAWQQPEKVIGCVAQSTLTHNGIGKAEIDNVMIASNVPRERGAHAVFAATKFCPSATRVTRVIAKGDGNPIPRDLEVVIIGLEQIKARKLPNGPGYYNIKGVTVSANGRCEIRCSRRTRFERARSLTEAEMAFANI